MVNSGTADIQPPQIPVFLGPAKWIWTWEVFSSKEGWEHRRLVRFWSWPESWCNVPQWGQVQQFFSLTAVWIYSLYKKLRTYQFALYQIIADFAFLPFGGGPRKCVGDQFALLESTVALALLLRKFDVELRGSPDEVEMVTGATIHTKNGLWCKLRKRTWSNIALHWEVALISWLLICFRPVKQPHEQWMRIM